MQDEHLLDRIVAPDSGFDHSPIWIADLNGRRRVGICKIESIWILLMVLRRNDQVVSDPCLHSGNTLPAHRSGSLHATQRNRFVIPDRRDAEIIRPDAMISVQVEIVDKHRVIHGRASGIEKTVVARIGDPVPDPVLIGLMGGKELQSWAGQVFDIVTEHVVGVTPVEKGLITGDENGMINVEDMPGNTPATTHPEGEGIQSFSPVLRQSRNMNRGSRLCGDRVFRVLPRDLLLQPPRDIGEGSVPGICSRRQEIGISNPVQFNAPGLAWHHLAFQGYPGVGVEYSRIGDGRIVSILVDLNTGLLDRTDFKGAVIRCVDLDGITIDSCDQISICSQFSNEIGKDASRPKT